MNVGAGFTRFGLLTRLTAMSSYLDFVHANSCHLSSIVASAIGQADNVARCNDVCQRMGVLRLEGDFGRCWPKQELGWC